MLIVVCPETARCCYAADRVAFNTQEILFQDVQFEIHPIGSINPTSLSFSFPLSSTLKVRQFVPTFRGCSCNFLGVSELFCVVLCWWLFLIAHFVSLFAKSFLMILQWPGVYDLCHSTDVQCTKYQISVLACFRLISWILTDISGVSPSLYRR